MEALSRRNALRAFVAAPVAARTMASEAVKAAGFDAAIAPGLSHAGKGSVLGHWVQPQKEDLLSQIKAIVDNDLSSEEIKNLKIEAAYNSRRLDPDIAMMRSISPVKAYEIQMRRNLEDAKNQRIRSLKSMLPEFMR